MLFNVFDCFQVQNVLICHQKNLEIFKIDVLKRGTTAEKGRCQRKARNIENMVCCFTAERVHKQLNVSISRNSLFLCFGQSVYLFLYCKLSSERVFLGFKCTCVWIMYRACTVIELCEEYLMKTRSLEYSYRFYWRIVTIFAPFSFFSLATIFEKYRNSVITCWNLSFPGFVKRRLQCFYIWKQWKTWTTQQSFVR